VRIRRFIGAAVVALALAFVPTSAPAATGGAGPPAAVAKTCSAGLTHAVINGQQKCLRRGEFCAHSADRQYRRYGFRCIRFYPNVGRYRLT
jgi:hypothetical protein